MTVPEPVPVAVGDEAAPLAPALDRPIEGAPIGLAVEAPPTVRAAATTGPGKSLAAVLGRTVVRWLRDQQRRGGSLTLSSEQDIVDKARQAWRAALIELGEQEAGSAS